MLNEKPNYKTFQVFCVASLDKMQSQKTPLCEMCTIYHYLIAEVYSCTVLHILIIVNNTIRTLLQ